MQGRRSVRLDDDRSGLIDADPSRFVQPASGEKTTRASSSQISAVESRWAAAHISGRLEVNIVRAIRSQSCGSMS